MNFSVENTLRGRKMKRMLETCFAELRGKYGLKQIELDILYYLGKAGKDVTATEICNNLFLNKGQVSRAMTSLTEKKIITAKTDETDKRVVWYTGTELNDIIVQEFDSKQKKIAEVVCEGIEHEDIKIFCRVAGQMLQNMDNVDKVIE